MAMTYREWLKEHPNGKGMQYQEYLTGLANAVREANEEPTEQVYNVRVTVVEEIRGKDAEQAIARLARQLTQAGFNVISGGPGLELSVHWHLIEIDAADLAEALGPLPPVRDLLGELDDGDPVAEYLTELEESDQVVHAFSDKVDVGAVYPASRDHPERK